MTITRHPHTDLLPGIWALRHNLTAYDAAYLVLARLLDAKLLTMDSALRKLAGS
jgi:predicted nucleic acid-binding protein